MKCLYLHQSAGLRIYDNAMDETLYIDTLEQAAQDAGLEISWPDEAIVRVFPLDDGRIAAVRQTDTGLSQEAASAAVESLYHSLATKADLIVEQQRVRLEKTGV